MQEMAAVLVGKPFAEVSAAPPNQPAAGMFVAPQGQRVSMVLAAERIPFATACVVLLSRRAYQEFAAHQDRACVAANVVPAFATVTEPVAVRAPSRQ
jgi:hypothetical protein